jgi:hypothetical protein
MGVPRGSHTNYPKGRQSPAPGVRYGMRKLGPSTREQLDAIAFEIRLMRHMYEMLRDAPGTLVRRQREAIEQRLVALRRRRDACAPPGDAQRQLAREEREDARTRRSRGGV